MKKSSKLALIGVGLMLLSGLYHFVTNSFDAWQYGWYHTLGWFWNLLTLAAWVLIGQFFYQLYKKTK